MRINSFLDFCSLTWRDQLTIMQKINKKTGFKGFFLIGTFRSGKDSFGTILKKYNKRTRTLSFAQPIRETIPKFAELFNRPEILEEGDEQRRFLQIFGTEIGRDIINQNIWVDALISRFDPHYTTIVTDTRFDNEATPLLNAGLIPIGIYTDPVSVIQRTVASGKGTAETVPAKLLHRSEALPYAIKSCPFTICNDSTTSFEEFRNSCLLVSQYAQAMVEDDIYQEKCGELSAISIKANLAKSFFETYLAKIQEQDKMLNQPSCSTSVV